MEFSREKKIHTIGIAIAILLNLVFMTMAFIQTRYSHDVDLLSLEKISEITALKGKLEQIDHVLTLSTKLYIANPTPEIKKKYLQANIEYKNAEEKILSFLNLEQNFKHKLVESNQKLVTIEKNIFDLVEKGKLEEANKLIDSEEYQINKLTLENSINILQIFLDKEIKDEEQMLRSHYYKTSIWLVIALITIIISIFFASHLAQISSKSVRKKNELLKQLNNDITIFKDIIDENNIVAQTDLNGKIIHVNDNFCKISKYERHELLGQDHRLLNSEYHPKEFFTTMWQTIKSGKTWRGEIKNKAKDGSFYWVETYIRPMFRDGRIDSFLAIRKDITKQKLELQDDLRLERLASIGETTAQIFHEVMTPLTVVKYHNSYIQKKFPDADEKISLKFKEIEAAVNTIQNIFKDMRSSLVSDQSFEDTDPNEVITEAIKMSSFHLRKANVEIAIENNCNFVFQSNKNQIVQVITNLIKNSCDAITDLDEKWIKIQCHKTGMNIYIEVSDSGNGIAENIRDKIFDKFFTTKQNEGGTGLGLGICKKMIQIHGGELYIDKESPHTKFVIKLPTHMDNLEETA